MSKKPIAIIWNDAHLKTGNERAIYGAFQYMVEYAVKNGIKHTIFAGDMFHSREFQRQEVLDTLDLMLSALKVNDITVDLIPGNHDKTKYSSEISFLKGYRYHPNVNYYPLPTQKKIENVKFTYIPFFSDDKLVPMIKDAEGADILVSHFEMQGSTHLGSVSEKTNITRSLLSKWSKTYLGHYHNHHEITKDIVHLPSFIQNNFGEDSNKGFSVIYDDLSYEIIKGKFSEFKKFTIELTGENINEVRNIIEQNKDSKDAIRIELTGSRPRLEAFDTSIADGTGIDIKKKFEKKYKFDDVESKPELVEKFSKDNIFETFKDFCDENSLDHSEGETLLNDFFKRKKQVLNE